MLLFLFALPRNATHVFGGKMLVLSLNVIDAETLGSHRKVNLYYNYYM